MCQFAQQTYSSGSSVPADARHLCDELLNRLVGDTTTTQDAALIMTELATNALRAGSVQIEAEVAVHRDHILVAVTDDANGQPEIQNFSPNSTHGRGLHIVSVLAHRWGIDQLTRGKQVWAELSIEASDAWECALPLAGGPRPI